MTLVIRGLPASQKATLSRFIKKVSKTLPGFKKGELSLIFVSDKKIRVINRRFLNHDFATDVIAFPYDGQAPEKNDRPVGDIYISVDTAKREARKGRYQAIQELALYALHGLLHLAGHDDHDPKKRKKM